MPQTSVSANGTSDTESEFDGTRKLSAESRGAATREFLTTLGKRLRVFAFLLGWLCAEAMHKLQRGYATWRRQGRSRIASRPAIALPAPAPLRRRLRSASARVLWTYGSGLAAVVVIGAAVFAAAMVWAVGDLSLEPHPDRTSRPSLILE